MQYFERVRLEYHPENAAPYDVLLGQFGRRIHGGADPPLPPPTGPLPADRVYFAETGHNVAGAFFTYWDANGGLAQFGYPLTEEFDEVLEDGKTYRVQYFERARFEHHPRTSRPTTCCSASSAAASSPNDKTETGVGKREVGSNLLNDSVRPSLTTLALAARHSALHSDSDFRLPTSCRMPLPRQVAWHWRLCNEGVDP